ncbi:MAG: hypothetical protein ACHQX1_00010 [Candidatus Micrarchaeales archaeon]
MSDISTLCDICGKIAKHTCKLCGKRVCDAHYDEKNKICTSCKKGMR